MASVHSTTTTSARVCVFSSGTPYIHVAFSVYGHPADGISTSLTLSAGRLMFETTYYLVVIEPLSTWSVRVVKAREEKKRKKRKENKMIARLPLPEPGSHINEARALPLNDKQ